MSSIKVAVLPISYVIYLLLVSFIILEIFFRFLPVSESFHQQRVDEEAPYVHFEPNRVVRKQIGFDFSHVTRKQVNNYGYLTDVNFTAGSQPVMVIGDSFVEAMQVSNNQTFHGLLGEKLVGQNMYAVALSGAPLSQYLAYAKFAEDEFDPTRYVFVIIENDFDESWFRFKWDPGFFYFDDNEELSFVEYTPSNLKSILRKSAFLRYLYLDLKIGANLGRRLDIFNGGAAAASQADFSSSNLNEERLLFGKRAAQLFLSKLTSIVNEKPVLLVLDGDRKAIYNEGGDGKRSDPQRELFGDIITLSEQYMNVQVLDMHPEFKKYWLEDKTKFDFGYDTHWNEHGHATVAEAILATGFLASDRAE